MPTTTIALWPLNLAFLHRGVDQLNCLHSTAEARANPGEEKPMALILGADSKKLLVTEHMCVLAFLKAGWWCDIFHTGFSGTPFQRASLCCVTAHLHKILHCGPAYWKPQPVKGQNCTDLFKLCVGPLASFWVAPEAKLAHASPSAGGSPDRRQTFYEEKWGAVWSWRAQDKFETRGSLKAPWAERWTKSVSRLPHGE